MGHREPLKGGQEYDCFTSWRKVLSGRHGRWRYVKAKFNRRVRKATKMEIQREDTGH